MWFSLNFLHYCCSSFDHRASLAEYIWGPSPSSPLFAHCSSPVLLQNKCFRYWPDKGCAKEYGCICVRNVSEREAQGYYLRELEILHVDRVS